MFAGHHTKDVIGDKIRLQLDEAIILIFGRFGVIYYAR